jgi:hypothetical protein
MSEASNTTMRTLIRRCAFVAILGSSGSLVASLVGVGRGDLGAPLRFQPSPVVIPGVLEVGKDYTVYVDVINASAEPARLVGSLDYCGGSCFSARGIPTLIPAMGKSRINVHVNIGSPGPLSGELILYTDRALQPTMTLNIEGVVLGGQTHDIATQAVSP